MTDHNLPLDWIDRELCGPIEGVTLDIEQPEPGVIDGTAVLLRRDDNGGEVELLIDGKTYDSVTVDPSPVIRTGAESWRALTREELSFDAEPGLGTVEIQFGDATEEITLFQPLPDELTAYHDTPNGDGTAGLDEAGRPTIRAGSETDLFDIFNTFSSIYREDGITDRSRVTARIEPIDNYPGFDPESGYGFARAGIMIRNSIPNDGDDSGYVHLFYTPTEGGEPPAGEVRLQADFTGDGYTAYNHPHLFETFPIPVEAPCWLRLERFGETFVSQVSDVDTDVPPPEHEWEVHRVEEIPNVAPIQDAGIYASNNDSQQIRATFDNVSSLAPLPDEFTTYHSPAAHDGLAGVRSDGTLTIVTGERTDLWTDVNEFSSIYVEDGLGSDGTITTRVLPIEDYPGHDPATGYDFVRAGLLIRNTIPNDGTVENPSDDDYGFVHLFYNPAFDQVQLQADYGEPNGFTDDGGEPPLSETARAPCWLRLRRSGETVVAELSNDGGTEPPATGEWDVEREISVAGASDRQDAGLYAAHNHSERVTARFDSFRIDNDGDHT